MQKGIVILYILALLLPLESYSAGGHLVGKEAEKIGEKEVAKLSLSQKIDKALDIKIQSCSMTTHDKIKRSSPDIGDCLMVHYIEGQLYKEKSPITMTYTKDGTTSQVELIWNPVYDKFTTEIKKLYRYYKTFFKSDDQFCATDDKSSLDLSLSEPKFLALTSTDQKMHSVFGQVQLKAQKPGQLMELLRAPALLANTFKLDLATEIAIDLEIDPNDFGNILGKIELKDNAQSAPLEQDYIQIKANFKCKKYHLELDPTHVQ